MHDEGDEPHRIQQPNMHPAGWNFDQRPLLICWETTKACVLACKHCRANAVNRSLPGELTTEEGVRLIDQIMDFGEPYPTLIFSGGDPLMRSDLFALIEYSVNRGLRVAVSPATPLLTRETIEKLGSLGVRAISISLDGALQETHDWLRGPGNYEATLRAIKDATELGIRTQVNTVVMRRNVEELADIFHLVRSMGVGVWEVFFLIKTGRGVGVEEIGPRDCEDVAQFLCDASFYGLTIRTAEGPHFRRVMLQRGETEDDATQISLGSLYGRLVSRLLQLEGPAGAESKAYTSGTRDGKGYLFVAHNGDLYPSGFLPLRVGNVRSDNLREVYCNSPLLMSLRDSSQLKGRCGGCGYRDICGGSRARAYAFFDDPLAEDPGCMYKPGLLQR